MERKIIKIKYVTQLPTQNPVSRSFVTFAQYRSVSLYENTLKIDFVKTLISEGVPVKIIYKSK